MTDYSFISGQIRAQESKLLSQAQIDRMVGAETADEAFGVMVESNYAEYIDESTTVKDFHQIIEQGLFETKEMILKGTNNDQGLWFLWLQYDVNNIKRALKAKLLEGADMLENFTDDNGYSRLGMIDESEINDVVFRGESHRRLPFVIHQAVRNAEKTYNDKQDFVYVEYAIDKALGSFFMDLRDNRIKQDNVFIKRLVRHWVDGINIKNLSRSLIIREELPVEESWLTGGNTAYSDAVKIKEIGQLMPYLSRTKYAKYLSEVSESDSVELLYQIERATDKYFLEYLRWENLGASPSLVIPISYFERRLHNSRVLKLIMYAKMSGLDSDTIYQQLEHI